MTLAELTERLGLPPRQIRFLIAEGILPPAQKTGRAADAYTEEHLSRAQRYLALHRLGMKPASIKVLMAFDGAVPIYQGHGIELRVDPTACPQAIDVDRIVAEVTAALRHYTKG